MTDQQPHTPTTREVIEVWEHHSNWSISDFDRWLATIEAAAEQRGAERALREAAKDWRWSAWADAPRNPIAAANYTGDWIENRADRIADKEGDDE